VHGEWIGRDDQGRPIEPAVWVTPEIEAALRAAKVIE
jgi:hypothetical protein